VRKEGILWNGSTYRCSSLQTRRFIPGGVPSGTAASTEIFEGTWWKKGNSHSSLLDIVGAYNSSYQFRMEVLGPSELGTTLLSCTKAHWDRHWEDCVILPGYLPTSSRFSYTLPDDAEMFMNGVLIDVYSQKWKAYVSDLLAFPPPLIEQAQQIIKVTIDGIITRKRLIDCLIFT
jgi:hypothetical protein